MKSETRREIVAVLARSVAHLYAIAGALASRRAWDADERAAELTRVVAMLKRAYDRLGAVPACAASVLEQCAFVHSVQTGALADGPAAMALARSGLVINTWCTAATMLVSGQATDGPLTIGGLVQLLGTVQPDSRYRSALADRLAAVAYDNSAVRQLGTCYFQAFEGYSLLELHHMLAMGDTARAADLLDNASRGALTAVRFLEREPLGDEDDDDDSDDRDSDDGGHEDDSGDTEQDDDSGDTEQDDDAADNDDDTDPGPAADDADPAAAAGPTAKETAGAS